MPKSIAFRIGKNGTNRAERRTMGTTTAYHETARVLHEVSTEFGGNSTLRNLVEYL